VIIVIVGVLYTVGMRCISGTICICVLVVTSVDNICIVHVIVLTMVQVAGKVLRQTYPIG